MPTEVAEKISDILAKDQQNHERSISVIWHGGEPLATGKQHFSALLKPFSQLQDLGIVSHVLQTNATLVDNEWCDMFKEHEFRISISMDGTKQMNSARVDWGNKPAFAKTIRGIQTLRSRGIDFDILAVVNRHNIDKPDRFLDFLYDIEPRSININVEEDEGLNAGSSSIRYDSAVTFWKDLFDSWRHRPTIKVREFDKVLAWMLQEQNIHTSKKECCKTRRESRNLWPTISWNGDVFIVSPELMSAADTSRFKVGNIMHENLRGVINKAGNIKYFKDFISGTEKCERECPYFEMCGGGQGSNKYFENGTLDTTETRYCINARKALVDGVLSSFCSRYRKSCPSASPAGKSVDNRTSANWLGEWARDLMAPVQTLLSSLEQTHRRDIIQASKSRSVNTGWMKQFGDT